MTIAGLFNHNMYKLLFYLLVKTCSYSVWWPIGSACSDCYPVHDVIAPRFLIEEPLFCNTALGVDECK